VTSVKKLEIEVCAWETITDIWAATSRYHRYKLNDGTKAPYNFAGLFDTDSVNCPVTAYTLHTSTDWGETLADYTGSDLVLDAVSGNLQVSTSRTYT